MDGSERSPVLRVTGLVDRPGEWAMSDLAELPGQGINRAGDGVAAGSVLAAARARGHYVSVESEDGAYRASIPIDELASKGLVIYGLDGAELPRERGGPFRMLVSGGRTLCWNVKGVERCG